MNEERENKHTLFVLQKSGWPLDRGKELQRLSLCRTIEMPKRGRLMRGWEGVLMQMYHCFLNRRNEAVFSITLGNLGDVGQRSCLKRLHWTLLMPHQRWFFYVFTFFLHYFKPYGFSGFFATSFRSNLDFFSWSIFLSNNILLRTTFHGRSL